MRCVMPLAMRGGAAGVGMGIGAGMGFGQMMAGAMTNQGYGKEAEKPAAAAASDPVVVLKKLKQLHEAELISDSEYEEKQREVLSRL